MGHRRQHGRGCHREGRRLARGWRRLPPDDVERRDPGLGRGVVLEQFELALLERDLGGRHVELRRREQSRVVDQPRQVVDGDRAVHEVVGEERAPVGCQHDALHGPPGVEPPELGRAKQLTNARWNCHYPSVREKAMALTCGIDRNLHIYLLPPTGTVPPDWDEARIAAQVEHAINRRRIQRGQTFFGWRNEFSENLRDLTDTLRNQPSLLLRGLEFCQGHSWLSILPAGLFLADQ